MLHTHVKIVTEGSSHHIPWSMRLIQQETMKTSIYLSYPYSFRSLETFTNRKSTVIFLLRSFLVLPGYEQIFASVFLMKENLAIDIAWKDIEKRRKFSLVFVFVFQRLESIQSSVSLIIRTKGNTLRIEQHYKILKTCLTSEAKKFK